MYPELWVMPGTGWALKSYGFMMMVGFLSGVYLAMRRCIRVKCDPDALLNCAFLALIVGVIGARIFFVIHYWDEGFADAPNKFLAVINITQGGLELLGGVIPATLVVWMYIWFKGWSVRVYADFMAVIVPWAVCFGRIGCFLNGCCFGGICVAEHHRPGSALAVQFPFASPAAVRQWEQRRVTIPAELIVDRFRDNTTSRLLEATPLGRDLLAMTPEAREKPLLAFEEIQEEYRRARADHSQGDEFEELTRQYKRREAVADAHRRSLSPLLVAEKYPSRVDPSRGSTHTEIRALAARHPAEWVHPTQLYSAASGFLLANLLARFFHRRKRHGAVFGLFLVLYPVSRVLLEMIRSDNPIDTFGLTVSQVMGLGMVAGGALWLFVIYRLLPEQSPAAIPWVPPEQEEAASH